MTAKRTGEGEPFSCRRGIAPMLWVLLGLACAELLAAHLLVALLWSRTAAVVLSLVSLAGIGWLVAAIRSLGTHPIIVGRDRVRLRAGRLAGIEIGRGDVAVVRGAIDGAEVRARDTLNLALIAYPNVIVDLRRPVRRRRRLIARVALKLDDPAAFTHALSPTVPAR